MKQPKLTYLWAMLFIAIISFSIVNTIMVMKQNELLQAQQNFLSERLDSLNEAHAALNDSYANLNENYQVLDQNYQALDQQLNSLNETYLEGKQTESALIDQLNKDLTDVNARLPIEQYDYAVTKQDGLTVAKNGKTGRNDFTSLDTASVLALALNKGNSIFIKNDEYVLSSNITLSNHKNARIDSDGAVLICNGKVITVKGDDYQYSQNNQISGLKIINGTVRIENSFETTVTNMIFENCKIAIELANTNTWTEATKIDTIHFNKCTQGIVFRSNTTSIVGNSTGSYGNTEINRCYFNLLDDSVAITVETQAEFTDSQIQNIRIWIAEFGKNNQTGLQLDGSMYQTLMNGVVFESFANGTLDNAALYAIKIGETAYQAPILQAGVSFLGCWTARIFNPNADWVYSVGGLFKQEDVAIPVGVFAYGEPAVIQLRPQTISDFKPKINVQGNFSGNETVTVRVRLEFVDSTVSQVLEKTFRGNSTLWLNDDDMMTLFPSLNSLWAILVDAKSDAAFTNVTVKVDVYGLVT